MLGRASYSYSVLQCRKKERDKGRGRQSRVITGRQTKQEEEKKESLLKKKKEMQVCVKSLVTSAVCSLGTPPTPTSCAMPGTRNEQNS